MILKVACCWSPTQSPPRCTTPQVSQIIDALIRRARNRLSRADIFMHTVVINLVGEPALIIGYEKISGGVLRLFRQFQVEEHKTGFQRFVIFKFEKVSFFLLSFIKRFEAVLFVKMKGLFIVVCVNNYKSASGFIVK